MTSFNLLECFHKCLQLVVVESREFLLEVLLQSLVHLVQVDESVLHFYKGLSAFDELLRRILQQRQVKQAK